MFDIVLHICKKIQKCIFYLLVYTDRKFLRLLYLSPFPSLSSSHDEVYTYVYCTVLYMKHTSLLDQTS